MRSFATHFVWIWLAGILLGLGWSAIEFYRMSRDPQAKYLYVKIPVTELLLYTALMALVVSTVVVLIRRGWKPLGT